MMEKIYTRLCRLVLDFFGRNRRLGRNESSIGISISDWHMQTLNVYPELSNNYRSWEAEHFIQKIWKRYTGSTRMCPSLVFRVEDLKKRGFKEPDGSYIAFFDAINNIIFAAHRVLITESVYNGFECYSTIFREKWIILHETTHALLLHAALKPSIAKRLGVSYWDVLNGWGHTPVFFEAMCKLFEDYTDIDPDVISSWDYDEITRITRANK